MSLSPSLKRESFFISYEKLTRAWHCGDFITFANLCRKKKIRLRRKVRKNIKRTVYIYIVKRRVIRTRFVATSRSANSYIFGRTEMRCGFVVVLFVYGHFSTFSRRGFSCTRYRDRCNDDGGRTNGVFESATGEPGRISKPERRSDLVRRFFSSFFVLIFYATRVFIPYK